MNPAYLTVIASMHLAFAGVFGFMFWQKRGRFARALGLAWILQALRIIPLLRQASGANVSTQEWAAADLLLPAAIWFLLQAGADLTEKRLPHRWGAIYIGANTAFILAAHYGGIPIVMRVTGLPFERAQFLAIFLRQAGLFFLGGVVLFGLAWLLYRFWRSSRMPGAAIAAAFAVPYALGVLVAPLQWYWSFYPNWNQFAWFLQVLGLSIGFLVLVLNREHAALMETLQSLRMLRGLLPICAACKRIRDDAGYWKEIETYIRDHSEAEFSHGLCPECATRLYPGLDAGLGDES